MSDFRFELDASPEENIARFFEHLEAIRPALTKLLRDNLPNMLPIPKGQSRTAARTKFNAAIRQALDALEAARDATKKKPGGDGK